MNPRGELVEPTLDGNLRMTMLLHVTCLLKISLGKRSVSSSRLPTVLQSYFEHISVLIAVVCECFECSKEEKAF